MAVAVRVAVAVGPGVRLTQGIDRGRLLLGVAGVAGGLVRVLQGRQQVVGVDGAAAAGSYPVDILRLLVGPARQVGLKRQNMIVAIVRELGRFVGVVGRHAVGVGLHGLGGAAE